MTHSFQDPQIYSGEDIPDNISGKGIPDKNSGSETPDHFGICKALKEQNVDRASSILRKHIQGAKEDALKHFQNNEKKSFR